MAAKSGPTALHKNLSRRVSFNEATLAKPLPPPDDDSDTESQNSRSRCACACGALFSSCCACVSIIIGVLIFLGLLVGGVYYALLQSSLPEVRLHRLDVYKLNVTNANDNTLLTTDIEIRLNTTNGNGKIGLAYGGMTASLSSEGVNLGYIKLPAMRQKPHTSTDLKVRTALNRAMVEEAAATELVDKLNKNLMVIDAMLKGHIDFYLGGRKFNGFGFKVKCHSIDQSEIDNGHAPKCNSKMTL
ncbi:hypothetical protein BUALT_Bualt13G0103700 [Buddleja alternifolia]|uniref:Late embryogenesis abundant protein LEA-2 subgroup domain-containing protein n=1 Tax=Buddleja alternifolia TaxID=168488 RepID=A0AAV6WNC7_9LAMI|nr:hypothetical protein BUALT_Bualt13G0103700 [Buddleja alternifolia]